MEFNPDVIMAIVCFVGFIAMFFLGKYLEKRKINDGGISKEFEVIFYKKNDRETERSSCRLNGR